MVFLILTVLLGHAEHAPTLRPPAELEITFDLPSEKGRCELTLAERSNLVELDGWTVAVKGSHLPDQIVGRAKMLLRHGLTSRAQGVMGWLLKALLNDRSTQWPSLLPATRALRATWTETEYDLVRETLAVLRRRATGWAFEVVYNWTSTEDGSKRHQILTIIIPKATYPRGVLVAVHARDGAPGLVNLLTPGGGMDQNAFIHVMVRSPIPGQD